MVRDRKRQCMMMLKKNRRFGCNVSRFVILSAVLFIFSAFRLTGFPKVLPIVLLLCHAFMTVNGLINMPLDLQHGFEPAFSHLLLEIAPA